LRYSFLIIFVICCLTACNQVSEDKANVQNRSGKTPATVTHIAHAPLVDYAEFKATSAYTRHFNILSPANGTVITAYATNGTPVQKDQLLFSIRPAEKLTERETNISLRSPATGIMQQVEAKSGDVVNRTNILGVVADANSFGFVFDSSQDFSNSLFAGKSIHIILSNGSQLNGFISAEKRSDTSFLMAKVNGPKSLSTGVKATIRVIRQQKSDAASLPLSAVISDTVAQKYWVMKMINKNTAVKVPVTVGMKTQDRVEILTPSFSPNDDILLTGNRGLPDTAVVNVAY